MLRRAPRKSSGVDALLVAIAPHRGLGEDHFRERLDRLLGFALLEKTDERIDEGDGENHRGIHILAEEERHSQSEDEDRSAECAG